MIWLLSHIGTLIYVCSWGKSSRFEDCHRGVLRTEILDLLQKLIVTEYLFSDYYFKRPLQESLFVKSQCFTIGDYKKKSEDNLSFVSPCLSLGDSQKKHDCRCTNYFVIVVCNSSDCRFTSFLLTLSETVLKQ